MTLPHDELDFARTVQRDPVAAGTALAGRYQLEQRIGVGGMGQVWRAFDSELNIPVAVKQIPTLLSGDPRTVAALKREAAIALRLSHPNICRLHTLQTDGELVFLVMELVEGQTLDQYTSAQPEGRLMWEALRPIVVQIADALDYAHGLDPPVLHRDIKPQNVVVSEKGKATLLDFGIAREVHDSITRMTGRDATSGTVPYMSPEQFRGETMQAASDVYSFAAVLYECLAGRPLVSPHGSLMYQILEKPFSPIRDVPDEVNRRLGAALLKDPQRRLKRCADIVGPARPDAPDRAVDPTGVPPWGVEPEAIAAPQDTRGRNAGRQPWNGQPERARKEVERDAVACANWINRGGAVKKFVTDVTSSQLAVWRHGAAMNWPAALWLVGLRLLVRSTPEHRREAFERFQAAAEAGYAPAQYSLGECYHHGLGTGPDTGRAVECFRAAAEQGFAAAEYNLARCCQEGRGVRRDRTEARHWYHRSGHHGYPDAQYALGVMYEEGFSRDEEDPRSPLLIEPNMEQAVAWYHMAAEAGDPRAQHRLACCYRDGRGVAVNPAEAAHWGRLAAEQGYRPARIWLEDQPPSGGPPLVGPRGPGLGRPTVSPTPGARGGGAMWWPIILFGLLGLLVLGWTGLILGGAVGWLVASFGWNR